MGSEMCIRDRAKVTAPAADKTEEEKLDQNLFDEEPEKQATEIDIDDLLG